jgi:hypothetical protein
MSLANLSHFTRSRTSTPEQEICEEWRGILEEYRIAAEIYSQAALDLTPAPGLRFDEAWTRAEQARKMCDVCRSRLLDHEHNHACLARPPATASFAVPK